MTLFQHRADSRHDEKHDELVEKLLATPIEDRKVVVMTALQTGDLRLSEADEVLLLVNRLERLSGPQSTAGA